MKTLAGENLAAANFLWRESRAVATGGVCASPGHFRPLVSERHFGQVTGRLVYAPAGSVQCPYCAEQVAPAAKCRACGSPLGLVGGRDGNDTLCREAGQKDAQ